MSTVVHHPPVRAGRGGLRMRSWWGKAWVRALEEAAYAEGDLRAARTLVRAGEIGGVTVAEGRLVASMPDAAGLFTPRVDLPVLDVDAAAALVEVVAAESGRVGALLSGDLPHALVEHAEEAGVELLPFGGELEGACSCEAFLDPCPHALALLMQAGVLLDADPFVLLHLRGMPRERLLAELHARDTAAAGPVVIGHEAADAAADPSLEIALDAVARATRILELAEQDAAVDHLL